MANKRKKSLLDLLEKKMKSKELDFSPELFVKVSTWIQIATAQELVNANVGELIQNFDFTQNDERYSAEVKIVVNKIDG